MQAFVEIPVLPPRSIVLHPPLSDEEFENLCERTEFVQLERTKEGTIRVNVPAGGILAWSDQIDPSVPKY